MSKKQNLCPQTTLLLQDWEKTLGKLALALSEAETTGDLTAVTKLQEELAVFEAQALELKKQFLPQDAFELVEDLGELGHRVTNTSDIHSQSDGTLAGKVMVDGKWQLFKGDTLITMIGGKEFTNTYYIHSQSDGTLAGQVAVDGKWLPFKGDTLITTIGGKEVTNADNIHSQSDGTLAGRVEVDGERQNFLIHPDGRSMLLG